MTLRLKFSVSSAIATNATLDRNFSRVLNAIYFGRQQIIFFFKPSDVVVCDSVKWN